MHKSALGRFPAGVVAHRVAAAAAAHVRIADLALSFPAALAAIAMLPSGAPAAAHARHLAVEGAPLRDIAAALALPMWLRKLPPQACCCTGEIANLPASPFFVRRIANHLPKACHSSADWLAWVAAANAACDEHFAIWAAREFRVSNNKRQPDSIAALGAFAWFSMRPDLEATALMPRRWTPAMRIIDACEQAHRWLDRLEAIVDDTGNGQARQGELREVDGLTFQRLISARDFLAASDALDNCLDGYDSATTDHQQVWAIVRNDSIVAAMEIEMQTKGPGLPGLVQLRSKENDLPPPAILRAAYRFLLEWPTAPVASTSSAEAGNKASEPLAVYQRLIKPYWVACRPRKALPMAPTYLFDAMRTMISELRWPARHRRQRRRQ